MTHHSCGRPPARSDITALPLDAYAELQFSIAFQNRIDEMDCRVQLQARTLWLLPRPGQRTADRLAHHPPVNAQLLGRPRYRPDPELVLSPDLFE